MSTLKDNPEISSLINQGANPENNAVLKVNNHIHSPYSFSAFENIGQAIDLAINEDVKILGINDFFVTDGYNEFKTICNNKKVYPLFNIEFIGLDKKFQDHELRVNDPNNPGRIYFSGKGLMSDIKLSEASRKKMESVIKSSQIQIKEMVDNLNTWLNYIDSPFSFTYKEILDNFAKNLVRERHIATAIRVKVNELYNTDEAKITFYKRLFDSEVKADVNNNPSIENEIRSKLLKSGGKAFVAEDDNAFLSVAEIKSIIIEAGGIPTYPLLLDDANGNFTDFEGDKDKLLEDLKKMGVYSIEFIPTRNTLPVLKEYSSFFYNNGFLVTYGTEHNSPALDPIEVKCSKNVNLDDELLEINYKSTCVIAAHQFLIEKGMKGFLCESGDACVDDRALLENLGNALIKQYLN